MALDTSLSSGLAAISSGAAFSKASAAFSNMSAITATLPPDAAAALLENQAIMESKMEAAKLTLSKDMGVAKTNIDLQNKIAFAASGFPASDSVLAAAAGPVGMLANGPSMLAEQAKTLSTTVSNFAATSGVSMQSLTSFASSVPTKFVKDSQGNDTNVHTTEYETFSANIANKANIDLLGNLGNTMGGLASSALTSITNLEASAKAAVDLAISNIKAMSTAALLTAPTPAALVGALNNAVDYSKISVDGIQKALNLSVPSIPSSIPGVK